jgi:hypothetical protein
MKAAAENLTSVLLELGGQNPALVDETAHIADAAKKIVWGAMAWGGQWCTSPGYAYVHESVSDAFVAEAKKAVVDLYGPDPRTNPDYSRVISAREVSRLAGLIDPAKVVAGGRSDPDRAPPVSCVATRSSSSGSRACGRDAAPPFRGKVRRQDLNPTSPPLRSGCVDRPSAQVVLSIFSFILFVSHSSQGPGRGRAA